MSLAPPGAEPTLDRSKTVGSKPSPEPLEASSDGKVVPWELRQKHKERHFLDGWAAADYDVDKRGRQLPQDPGRAPPTRQQTTHFGRDGGRPKPPPQPYQFPRRRHSFSGTLRGENELKKKRGWFLEELRQVFHAAPPLPKSRGDRCRPPDAKRDEDDASIKYEPDLHSDVALLVRESLRYDEAILRWLNKFWLLAIAESGNRKEMRFDKYKKFHACMYRALHSEWDPFAALQTAVQDWDLDSMGYETLNKARFLRCLFEVADVWTNHVMKKQYLGFLKNLFDHVSFYDLDRKLYVLKKVEDVKVGATARAAAGEDWVTKSMMERARFLYRQKQAERLQQHWRERKRREDPAFRDRRPSAAGAAGAAAGSARRMKPGPSPGASAAPGIAPTRLIDESTYEHLLGRRRSTSAVGAGARRPSVAPGEEGYAELSEQLFGWALVRALLRVGPGFPRRLEEGPVAVALVRAARQAVRDYFAEHGASMPVPESKRRQRAATDSNPRPASRAAAGNSARRPSASQAPAAAAAAAPKVPGLGEVPGPAGAPSAGKPDTARLRDPFMAVATSAADAFAARHVIAYPVRGAPAPPAAAAGAGPPVVAIGARPAPRPGSVAGAGPFGGVQGQRPGTSPAGEPGALPGVVLADAGRRPAYRRPGLKETKKAIPNLSAVPLIAPGIRISGPAPNAAPAVAAARGAPAVAPSSVTLPPIGLSVRSAKRQ